MGSDIYTESAVAIELDTFLNRKAIKKKSVRTDIANTLFKEGIINEEVREQMIKNRDGFIEGFVSAIDMSEGYESNEETNHFMIRTFCLHTDIDPDDLPEWNLRMFDSCRQSGYDVLTDTLYIMFEDYDLFETVMTDLGKELAKTLEMNYVSKTTWTVHSY